MSQLKYIFSIPLPAYGQRNYNYIMAANIRGTIFSQWIIFKVILNQVPYLILPINLVPSTESCNNILSINVYDR